MVMLLTTYIRLYVVSCVYVAAIATAATTKCDILLRATWDTYVVDNKTIVVAVFLTYIITLLKHFTFFG